MDGAKVAINIDDDAWPYPRLMIRGTVAVTDFPGIVPGYRETAERYLGDEQGKLFISSMESMEMAMKRIAVKPAVVGLFDFETRFPGLI